MQHDFITPREIASEARLADRRTVYSWVKAGRLRAFRAGRLIRIDRKDWERFMSRKCGRPDGQEEPVPAA